MSCMLALFLLLPLHRVVVEECRTRHSFVLKPLKERKDCFPADALDRKDLIGAQNHIDQLKHESYTT